MDLFKHEHRCDIYCGEHLFLISGDANYAWQNYLGHINVLLFKVMQNYLRAQAKLEIAWKQVNKRYFHISQRMSGTFDDMKAN